MEDEADLVEQPEDAQPQMLVGCTHVNKGPCIWTNLKGKLGYRQQCYGCGWWFGCTP